MQNDDLITEIEQFLADGGEPPEPSPAEQAAAAFEAFAAAMQSVAAAIVEALQPLFDAIAAWARRCYAWLYDALIGLRRDQLRQRLEAWRLPRPVAAWIASRWPRRWLPESARHCTIFMYNDS